MVIRNSLLSSKVEEAAVPCGNVNSLQHPVGHHPPAISLRTHIGYGLGHVLNDVCSSLIFSYLLLYTSSILQFKPHYGGLIFLSGQIADAVSNFLVGYVSEKTKKLPLFKRFNRKIWHFIGTLIVGIYFPLVFIYSKWSMSAYALSYIFLQCGWAAAQNSHLTLLTELGNTEDNRQQLSSIRCLFTNLTNIFVYISSWYLLHKNDHEDKSTLHYLSIRDSVLLNYSIAVLLTVTFYFLVKEHKVSEDNAATEEVSVKQLITDSSYYMGNIVYMSISLCENMIQLLIPLYLHETFNINGSSLVVIPLCIYIPNLILSLFENQLTKIFQRLVIYFAGLTMINWSCLWIYQRSELDGFQSFEIYCLAISIGISISFLQMACGSIVVGLIPHNSANYGSVFGFMTLSNKISTGILVFAIELLHDDENSSKMFYGNTFALVCGSATLIAVPFTLILSKRISDKSLYIPIP